MSAINFHELRYQASRGDGSEPEHRQNGLLVRGLLAQVARPGLIETTEMGWMRLLPSQGGVPPLIRRRQMRLSLAEVSVSSPAALVYDDGAEADAILAEAVAELRQEGVAIAGLLQHLGSPRSGGRPAVWGENLSSGARIRLDCPRDAGPFGSGGDRTALVRVACMLDHALANPPDLVVVNRFGRAEAEGRGLCREFGRLIEAQLPLLTAVRFSRLPDWEAFLGHPAYLLLPTAAAVTCWALDQIGSR